MIKKICASVPRAFVNSSTRTRSGIASGSSYKKSSTSCWVFVLFSLTAEAAWEPNKSFPIPLVEMFGGGALTEAFTLKSFVGGGGKTGSFDPNKLKDGGGGGGLGPPSKKSSIVGKFGGSPPGPKRFELLLLLLLLLLLFVWKRGIYSPKSI